MTRLPGFDSVEASTWNAVVETSSTCTVFQTHQWHVAWWMNYGGDHELLLFCAAEGDRWVGLIACALDAVGTVRFVGHGKSDFVDVICPADRSDVRVRLLRSVAEAAGRWRRMELRNLPEDSPTVGAMAELGWRALEVDSTPCPTLLIDGHSEFFAEVLRKKSLRRHHNYFKKQPGYTVEHSIRAAEIEPQLAAFFEQHIARWQPTSSPSLFLEEADRRFYSHVLEALDGTSWLRFTRLAVAEVPIAFHFGFAYRGVFVWYKPSFEISLAKRSPGEALLKELLERAGAEGCSEFDFTVGDEAFKSRFSNHQRRNSTFTVFAKPLDFWVQSSMLRAKRSLKSSQNGRRVFELAKRVLRR